MRIVTASWFQVSFLFGIPFNIFLIGLILIHISNMVHRTKRG